MNNQLYIPDTITVGFQERSDTFTGKLGYVIYTDHNGKLRKETSWNSWRTQSLGSITVDNKPTQGHTLNKGVQRDGHWGSGRSVVRVWDPRDFEFEISIDNLIGVLMHADVCKRDITESCVFAWKGTELILLPTNSVEYQESVKHTSKQSVKFSARDLVVGHTYGDKRDNVNNWVYLGRHQQYEPNRKLNEMNVVRYNVRLKHTGQRLAKVKHVFARLNPVGFEIRDPSFISGVVNDEMHPDFANLMTRYYKRIESQPWIGISSGGEHAAYYYDFNQYFRSMSGYVTIDNNRVVRIQCSTDGSRYSHSVTAPVVFETDCFYLFGEDQKLFMSHYGDQSHWNHSARINKITLNEFNEQTPEVIALMDKIKAIYQSVFDDECKHDGSHLQAKYNPRNQAEQDPAEEAKRDTFVRRRHQAAMKVIKEIGMAANIEAVLADGNKAVIDYSYFSTHRVKD